MFSKYLDLDSTRGSKVSSPSEGNGNNRLIKARQLNEERT